MNFLGITGRLGQDPELKYLTSGKAVVNFSIAHTTKWGDQKKTHWFRGAAFGKTAELIVQHFKKGDQIGVMGSLSDDSYTDQQGQRKEKIQIIVNSISWDATKQSANNMGQQTAAPQSQGTPQGVSQQTSFVSDPF